MQGNGHDGCFLPEFDQMAQTVQNNPHHCYDVAEHTIQALMHSAPEKTLRLALLFHDMGKAKTRTTDQDGVDHFMDIRRSAASWQGQSCAD